MYNLSFAEIISEKDRSSVTSIYQNIYQYRLLLSQYRYIENRSLAHGRDPREISLFSHEVGEQRFNNPARN